MVTTVETEGLPLNQAIGAYRELQSKLENIFRLGEYASTLRECLDACDRGIVLLWHDLEAVGKLQKLIDTLLAERELQDVCQLIGDVENTVHAFCLHPQAAPENHRVYNAVHGRLPDEYVRGVSELDRLWKCRRLCQERDQLLT